MKLGTTFFERAVPPHHGEDHLSFLAQSGFQSVEFCVHQRLMPKQDSYNLIKAAARHHLEVYYHSPDFIEPQAYSLKQFLNDERASAVYRPYLYDLADLNLNNPHPQKIIFHSVASESRMIDDPNLLDENLRAMDSLLNFIVREGFPFEILLENTSPLDEPTIGSDPKFLMRILNTFRGSPLSLCLDLPHWYRTHQSAPSFTDYSYEQDALNDFYFLNPLLLEAISYAHLHGFSDDFSKSHLPLKDEHKDFINFVKAFSSKKDQIIFNLEIFDLEDLGNVTTYESLLQQHIKKIENY